jgi:hypothetical protein
VLHSKPRQHNGVTAGLALGIGLLILAGLALHGQPFPGIRPRPNPSYTKHIVFMANWLPRTRAATVLYNPTGTRPVIPANPQPQHANWKSRALPYANTPASMQVSVAAGLTAICTILVDNKVVASNANGSRGRDTTTITSCTYDGHTPT